MDIVNCVQCNRPFQRTGGHTMCGGCLETEYSRYDRYYRKLGKHLEHLNMIYLAQKTGLSSQRLANSLYFRLGNGAIKDLPLWKRGYCNVCHQRLKNADSVEPICLHCIELILPLIDTDPQALFASESEKRAQSSQQELDPLPPPPVLPTQTPVPELPVFSGGEGLSELEALRAELAHYKALYHAALNPPGHLPANSPGNSSAMPSLVSHNAAPAPGSPSPQDWREILNILERSDDDTTLSPEDLRLLQTHHLFFARQGQIRHYGFKRNVPTA